MTRARAASPWRMGSGAEWDGRAARDFVLRFAIIVMTLACLPLLPGWDQLVARYMGALGWVVNSLLHLLGQPTRVEGVVVSSPAFNVTLTSHCSALDIVLLYTATVLACSAPALQKVAGILIGFTAIALLNVLRVASIFLTGARWPARVQAVHEELWPVLLIIGALLLCGGWLHYAGRYRAPASN